MASGRGNSNKCYTTLENMTSKTRSITLLMFTILSIVNGYHYADNNDYQETICISETNTYTAKIDLYAGEWGKLI